ncbi:MAG: right-handed parallel beta-helix repeat-containing protein, partial [Bacteroidetes bacterium]|nr:right-handed parallel beta-helix repeat-containing protein [Bacteroidota bacterium]
MAQDCGCDYTITASQGYIRATDVPAVKPGSTVCIKAGVRGRLKLIGFQGTKEQPITFKNCGGQVIFDNPDIDGTFVFESCKYFRVTGTGDPRHEFGFLIRNAGKGSAMYVTESDFELDHIEIADAGFAGIMAKIDPSCDNTQYHRQNFVMRNISVHDNYIHHTYGEGMYIGSTSYTGKSLPCGTAMPHLIEGLRVFNNRVEYTDADGIQISSAVKDVEVFNNSIYRYGQDPFKSVQNNGLMIGGGANGKYYNNKIIEGTGMGINCFGLGDVYIYNNLVVKSGYDGIFIDERSKLTPNTGFHAHNNTVVSPGRDGIRMYSRNSVGNTFRNNLLVAPASLSIEYYNKDQYLYIIDKDVKYTQSNNLFIATVKEALFADPATNNYQLQEQSPAVDKGMQLNYFNYDHNRTPRPQGNGWDIGSYEFSGALRTSNSLPTVSAGSDKSVTLPTNSLGLYGSASDADGSISSTVWTKVSGPSATMNGATTLKLGLSHLVEGTYTFRLTATDNCGARTYDDVVVTVAS